MRRRESVSCMVNVYNRILVEGVQGKRQIGKPIKNVQLFKLQLRDNLQQGDANMMGINHNTAQCGAAFYRYVDENSVSVK